MATTHSSIESNIRSLSGGDLLFPTDFRGKGTEAAIKMTLSRLNKEGIINRLGHGIYVIPKKDPLFGEVLPPPEEIAMSLAKREHLRIKPAGANALHKLGLTTQVPMKLVYLTDGTAREIKLGKTTIKFKPTTPKKLSLKGKVSSLIIQALEELGTKSLGEDIEKKIKTLLQKENPADLQHDLKLATAPIYDYLLKIYQNND
jgi:hypothetical protein